MQYIDKILVNMNDIIIKKLIENIEKTNDNKSSHWKLLLPEEKKFKDYKHLDDQLSRYFNKKNDFLDKFEHLGGGSFTLKSKKDVLHKLLQKTLYGNNIFKTNTFKKYKTIFDKQNRFMDNDAIRHIFTYEKLKKILNPISIKSICIIGDGKLNGVLGAYLTFPKAKIYTINLSEILINDYLILKDFKDELKISTELVDNIKFKITDKKLYLVPSNFKKILLNKKIDLFINIAAFQEMNMNEINQYFKIIKNNKSKLYCCNREYKKLPGGEELFFDKYKWGKSKKIFWEYCPWYHKYFDLNFPFIHKYDGKLKHCLVDFE